MSYEEFVDIRRQLDKLSVQLRYDEMVIAVGYLKNLIASRTPEKDETLTYKVAK